MLGSCGLKVLVESMWNRQAKERRVYSKMNLSTHKMTGRLYFKFVLLARCDSDGLAAWACGGLRVTVRPAGARAQGRDDAATAGWSGRGLQQAY